MSHQKRIKVLLVESQPAQAVMLAQILYRDPRIDLIGTAATTQRALSFLSVAKPDVVLLDALASQANDHELSRKIMENFPVPIVLCAPPGQQPQNALDLTEIGAVAGVQKPLSPEQPNFDALCTHLLQTIKLMSEIKVVRRWRRNTGPIPPPPPEPKPQPRILEKTRFVGIGASTGGPPVLRTIVSSLPPDFCVPVLIVQHIAPGFLDNLIHWVQSAGGPAVTIGTDGQTPEPGKVYFAPDGRHMGVDRAGRIILSDTPPESNIKPAVSFLFRSLAEHFGPTSIGVLLTGMGRDGAAELKRMRDNGSYTIAQDHESSVVNGMPGEAVKLEAAASILPPDKIGPAIINHVIQHTGQGPRQS